MKKILAEDLRLLDMRVKQLRQELFDMGEEFGIAVSQSSETWHDNAPFDFARDKQSLLHQELLKLLVIRKESLRYKPSRKPTKVGIGSKVILHSTRHIKIMIGGNWVARGYVDGYKLITCEAPVAMQLIGKSIGETVEMPTTTAVIQDIA